MQKISKTGTSTIMVGKSFSSVSEVSRITAAATPISAKTQRWKPNRASVRPAPPEEPKRVAPNEPKGTQRLTPGSIEDQVPQRNHERAN